MDASNRYLTFDHVLSITVCTGMLAIATTIVHGQTTTPDMGPQVTISGNPAPPVTVFGQVKNRPGSTVAITVSATGQGFANGNPNLPNLISHLELWADHEGVGSTPSQPGTWGGSTTPPSNWTNETGAWQSPVTTFGSPGSTGTGSGGWVFKWDQEINPGVATASATWNLYFYYSPGWYFYVGGAQDDPKQAPYNQPFGGTEWRFWSKVLGAYNSI